MNVFLAASLGDTITDAVNEVAKALRYPVLILALLALAIVAYELGRLGVEALKRSQRSKEPFDALARRAMDVARAGDSAGAQAIVSEYSYGGALQGAAVGTMFAANPVDAQRAVVDYDLYVSKRLDRVRLLVRAGPALGLMGTLIPLAPALAALGKGDAKILADELQTAFAITVVGVMIGLVAFAVAVVRERFYTKDLADLEFLREIRGDAITVSPAGVPQPSASAPVHATVTDQPAAETVATQPAATQPALAPQPDAQPQAVEPASFTATQPAVVQPAAPAPAAPKKKKKFGVSRKSDKAAPAPAPVAPQAFPPPPPPPAPLPTPPAPAGDTPADKSPSIPDAPPLEADPNAGPETGGDPYGES